MFKMSKAQMNNVNGGRKIKCVVLDVESGWSKEIVMESAVSVDDAVSVALVTHDDGFPVMLQLGAVLSSTNAPDVNTSLFPTLSSAYTHK